MSKRILITGGCGFVGSSLAICLKRKYPAYEIYTLDNLKRRGSELNLPRLKDAGVHFIHGDIRNKSDFENFKDIQVVIDAAAEPSVLSGLDGSTDYLIDTNLQGTIHTLNFALAQKADFIFLSTSRVYPIEQIEQIKYEEEATRFKIAKKQTLSGVSENGISEQFSTDGYRSLYGATKLACELLIREYQALLGLKTVVNRCGVITGPFQMGKVDQGVIVLWMARHFWKKNLTYNGYGGQGKQVRDILHADDLFRLVDLQIHGMSKFNGGVFNVGGGNFSSVSLAELTTICQAITGNKIQIHPVAETRKADIRIYLTDNEKIHSLCGWKPEIAVERTMQDIFEWIRSNESLLSKILQE
jgi:CDP-paratose 2-epimerase